MLPNTIKYKMKPDKGRRYHHNTPARVEGTIFTLQDGESTLEYVVTSAEFLEREPGMEITCIANTGRSHYEYR